jgi:hypothetical protein
MSTLLRDTKTGMFLARLGEWTHLPELARHFEASAKAIQFVFEAKLRGVEVLLTYSNPEFNVVVARIPS